MYISKLIFSHIISFLPKYKFRKCVSKYKGDYKVQNFSCWDQFLCMAYAQLTYRDSLRDTIICLNAFPKKLYHMGIRSRVSRSTLAHANKKRDWRIYAEFAQVLISNARRLYRNEDFGVTLDEHCGHLQALCLLDYQVALLPGKVVSHVHLLAAYEIHPQLAAVVVL